MMGLLEAPARLDVVVAAVVPDLAGLLLAGGAGRAREATLAGAPETLASARRPRYTAPVPALPVPACSGPVTACSGHFKRHASVLVNLSPEYAHPAPPLMAEIYVSRRSAAWPGLLRSSACMAGSVSLPDLIKAIRGQVARSPAPDVRFPPPSPPGVGAKRGPRGGSQGGPLWWSCPASRTPSTRPAPTSSYPMSELPH